MLNFKFRDNARASACQKYQLIGMVSIIQPFDLPYLATSLFDTNIADEYKGLILLGRVIL